MLADSENEKSKWVGVLSELHKILKKNKFRDRSVYVPKEAYDSTLPLIKTTQAAAIIGMDLLHYPARFTPLTTVPVLKSENANFIHNAFVSKT